MADIELSASELAESIVSFVRKSIQSLCFCNPPCNSPWDEEEGGSGWLHNEVGFACDFIENNSYNWWHIHTVQDFQKILENLPLNHLKFIKHVVVDLGGTTKKSLFKLRDSPRSVINQYFKNYL